KALIVYEPSYIRTCKWAPGVLPFTNTTYEYGCNFIGYHTSTAYGIYGLCSVGLLLCVCTSIALHCRRGHSAVRGGSYLFCQIILSGVIIAFIGATMFVGPNSPPKMSLQIVLICLAINLIMAALIVKLYRVWKIFVSNNDLKRSLKLRDRDLMIPFIGFMAIAIVILLATCFMGQGYSNESMTQTTLTLESPQSGTFILSGVMVESIDVNIANILPVALWAVALLFIAMVMSFLVRGVPSEYNETSFMLAVIYQILFVTSVMCPIMIFMLVEGNTNAFIFSACGVVFISGCFITIVLFFPKLFATSKRLSYFFHTAKDYPVCQDEGTYQPRTTYSSQRSRPMGSAPNILRADSMQTYSSSFRGVTRDSVVGGSPTEGQGRGNTLMHAQSLGSVAAGYRRQSLLGNPASTSKNKSAWAVLKHERGQRGEGSSGLRRSMDTVPRTGERDTCVDSSTLESEFELVHVGDMTDTHTHMDKRRHLHDKTCTGRDSSTDADDDFESAPLMAMPLCAGCGADTTCACSVSRCACPPDKHCKVNELCFRIKKVRANLTQARRRCVSSRVVEHGDGAREAVGGGGDTMGTRKAELKDDTARRLGPNANAIDLNQPVTSGLGMIESVHSPSTGPYGDSESKGVNSIPLVHTQSVVLTDSDHVPATIDCDDVQLAKSASVPAVSMYNPFDDTKAYRTGGTDSHQAQLAPVTSPSPSGPFRALSDEGVYAEQLSGRSSGVTFNEVSLSPRSGTNLSVNGVNGSGTGAGVGTAAWYDDGKHADPLGALQPQDVNWDTTSNTSITSIKSLRQNHTAEKEPKRHKRSISLLARELAHLASPISSRRSGKESDVMSGAGSAYDSEDGNRGRTPQKARLSNRMRLKKAGSEVEMHVKKNPKPKTSRSKGRGERCTPSPVPSGDEKVSNGGAEIAAQADPATRTLPRKTRALTGENGSRTGVEGNDSEDDSLIHFLSPTLMENVGGMKPSADMR
ncbi:hypothetical protein SARC_11318, partial [Sphaeroforma arctica JP610]